MADETVIRPLREVPPGHICCGRQMQKVVGQPTPRIKVEDDGRTRQLQVLRTHYDCDRCGERRTEEQVL